jgi:hypothetical protein
MNVKISYILILLVLMLGGVFAYQGFNRYYYTNNYQPTVYYPAPVAQTYTTYTYTPKYQTTYYYPSAYTTYTTHTTYPYYYGTTHNYPIYNTYQTYSTPIPRNYQTIGAYRNNDGFGFYYSSGSVCGIYGYC